MKWIVLAVFILFAAFVMSAPEGTEQGPVYNVSMGTGVYFNPFLRAPNYIANFSVDYTKLPWPKITAAPLSANSQRSYDVLIETNGSLNFDPTICPGHVAVCYAFFEHVWNGTLNRGENYTGVSGYVLPDKRVKQFVCAGNNSECLAQANTCFCPEEVPTTPNIRRHKRSCPQNRNLCQQVENGPVVLCVGNMTYCQSQYSACSCGTQGFCTGSKTNACLNLRNELQQCGAPLSSCMEQYSQCFCGMDMMELQLGCAETNHLCESDGEEVVCIGDFADCIARHDTCSCGRY